MARKVVLSSLLDTPVPGIEDEPPATEVANEPAAEVANEPAAEATDEPAAAPAKARATAPDRSAARRASGYRPKKKPVSTEPRYLQMDRKEARLRPGQYEDLTLLSRELNRSRNHTGERITENTLIRIGVDLLLELSKNLQGDDEEALRKSVGL